VLAALRRLLLPLCLGGLILVASLRGRLAGVVAAAASLGLVALVFVVLPRLAHAAFGRGDWRRAELYYRLSRFFVGNPESRGSIDVSLAGCRLARADWSGALVELGEAAPEVLGVAARAAWYNNRAYALARGGNGGGKDGDGRHALEAVDEAVRLRPDIAGFRHTRGVVLLGLGRLDDAIAELDAVWQAVASGDAPPLLEAERCYDLGLAWQRKGEAEYALDYFQRAQLVAPRSAWALKAEEALAGLQPRRTAPAT